MTEAQRRRLLNLRSEFRQPPSCYIAGPMRGVKGRNYPAFNEAAFYLRDNGWGVSNPAETDAVLQGLADRAANPLRVYMTQDLPDVAQSDVVFVLDGWEGSEGACLEVEVARRLKIPVFAFPRIVLVEAPVSLSKPQEAAGWVPGTPESVAAEGDRLVSSDRGPDYGHPLDDFGKVVGMARALWGRGPETEEEHAMYMILVKVAREANRHKRDNLVDICGYAKTLEMVIDERRVRLD